MEGNIAHHVSDKGLVVKLTQKSNNSIEEEKNQYSN